jgi:hypothetical protein
VAVLGTVKQPSRRNLLSKLSLWTETRDLMGKRNRVLL